MMISQGTNVFYLTAVHANPQARTIYSTLCEKIDTFPSIVNIVTKPFRKRVFSRIR